MTLRFGVIGLSPGNGHPYSWSAILNGYDPEAMKDCGFPVIPAYLAQRHWPEDRLSGARVTHVWAQDQAVARQIARASLVDHVVARPQDMLGQIDALLLARDDAEKHAFFAEPFLRAGLPVYIDKPVATREAEFDHLLALQVRPGQIFSCSALRFAAELQLSKEDAARIGSLRLIQGVTPKSWTTYAIHLIDPLLVLLGYEARPTKVFSGPVGQDGRILGIRYESGPDVHLMATGANVSAPLQLRISGEQGHAILEFSDSFGAFKAALAEFILGIHGSHVRTPEEFNRRAVQILEMGQT